MMGRPLSCDESTFCCTRLDYERVCVEIDTAKPFIKNFDLKNPFSADPLHIEVEYKWKPARCEKCRVFGHVCTDKKENVLPEEGQTTQRDLTPVASLDEEESSANTVEAGGQTDGRDTSPGGYTKVRKKKGGKNHGKGTSR
ncbi:hypothetical protein OIU84_028947 [Salix udensis]|uniref:Uncharacterized protein n=1 Tax=Salix udensis TaxID=889485 RepID=A0AAD6KE25_9ROSI|nr:hypothetical protein OIU84_028947 [Salix udensis]